MSEEAQRYQAVAAGFGTRLAAVGEDQWSAPSPCAEWDTREVATHVIAVHRRVLATLGGGSPEEVDPSGDLVALWHQATDAIANAVADDVRAQTVVGGMFGEQPFSALVGRLLCADTLVHTWDLARATGQDEQLDTSAVAACLAFLTPLDDAIRRPGGFAARVPSAPDADEQTVLLNFCGRAV